MTNAAKKADAVFEGGGVKGIGLVGALAVTEEQGYEFENVAGTSAGAIVAALVAAGYVATEIKAILDGLDYTQFKDESLLDKLPVMGRPLNLVCRKGIYKGEYFETWLRALLARKQVRTFGDLVRAADKDDPRYRYKLQVVASDISRGKMLVLPGDLADYGLIPDAFDVAHAVRMSMSIPFFFEPVKLRTALNRVSYVVDGGVLSNYPVWLLDDGTPDPPWPTFGYKLVDPQELAPHTILGPVTLFAALFATMMEAHDARYIQDHDFVRTIPIPTLGVRTTEFDLTHDRAEKLYQSGTDAAAQFFKTWDFISYKTRYRQAVPLRRRDALTQR